MGFDVDYHGYSAEYVNPIMVVANASKIMTYANVFGNMGDIPENTTFKEWNTNSDGTGDTYQPNDTLTKDLTLYAIFKYPYVTTKTVTFEKPDGHSYKIRGLTQAEENKIAEAGTDLTGATASTNGVHGLVPAPVAGDQGKVLMGSGNWDYASAAVYSFELDEVSNVSGAYTHTTSLAGVTSDMTPIRLKLEDGGIFKDKIDVECGNGSITLSCNDVVGTSDVTVYVLKQVHSNWEVLTSDEYDELAGMIGDLDDSKQDKTDNGLGTTAKTVVGAVNELNSKTIKNTESFSSLSTFKTFLANMTVGKAVDIVTSSEVSTAIAGSTYMCSGIATKIDSSFVDISWVRGDSAVGSTRYNISSQAFVINDINSKIANLESYTSNSPQVYDFVQANVARTITFGGTFAIKTRQNIGFIVVEGQSGTTSIIPIGFGGNGSTTQPSDLIIGNNSDGITVSGMSLNIPANLHGGWGSITIIIFRKINGLTITMA